MISGFYCVGWKKDDNISLGVELLYEKHPRSVGASFVTREICLEINLFVFFVSVGYVWRKRRT